ncbi:MAG: response regulator transcription factor [Lewinellaceae bacterium]|nr:response regulator transcription factor [Lewinellaceae bacterium]
MKNHWSNILFYGLTLGLLLASLQFLQYKWVLLKSDFEWYGGIIALLFTVLGIWAGQQWKGKKPALVEQTAQHPFPPRDVNMTAIGITPRELQVLQLMALGHSNQEIADLLFLSLNTVKTHISNLLSKLDVERRTQAILKAKTLGLLPK